MIVMRMAGPEVVPCEPVAGREHYCLIARHPPAGQVGGMGVAGGRGGCKGERGWGRERGLEGEWRGGERAHMGGMCDVRVPEPVPGREGRRWALPCPCRPWPQRKTGGWTTG